MSRYTSYNKEKYIFSTKHVDDMSTLQIIRKKCISLRFIDSYKFLSISLEKLASYLDKDKLKITRSEFFNLSAENFDLTRKGIFQCTSTLTASKSYKKPSYHRVYYFIAH